MCCFVILLLSNEMQMSVRRFSAIPHLRAGEAQHSGFFTTLQGQSEVALFAVPVLSLPLFPFYIEQFILRWLAAF